MTPRSAGAALIALAFGLTLAPAAMRATTVVAKSFAELGAEADLVFVGTVTASESGWSDAARRAIETRVTFGDLTWLRGDPRPSVTLRFAGGTVDGLSEEIAGVPRFAVGDRVVMFAREGEYVSPIVGFHQGLFRVVGDTVVDAAGHPVSGVSGAAVRRQAPGATPAPALSLGEFLERVRRTLER